MVLAVASTLPLVRAVLAEPADGGNDAIALKRFEDGKGHYDTGEFALSLIDFQASMAMKPSPNSRLYIARCQRALGKIGSAYVSYRLAMREAKDRLEATGEKRFAATRDAAATELAEIEDQVSRLTVTVPNDVPSDFVVTLDGAALPKEAWGSALEVDPGKHLVTSSGAFRKGFSAPFTLAVGDQKTIAVVAKRIPTGTLKIVLQSKAAGLSLQVDGHPIEASATTLPMTIEVGAHTLVVVTPGYEDFIWEGGVEDGQEVEILISPSVARSSNTESSGTPRWVPLTVSALGAITIAGGTLYALQAKSLSNAEKDKDPLLRDPAEHDRIHDLSTRANILFVAGGVLAIGATILSFTAKWSTPKGEAVAHVSPWVAAQGGGLAAWGAF